MNVRRPARFFVPATLALSIVTGIHVIAHAADDDGGTATTGEDGGAEEAAVPRDPSNPPSCAGGGPHANEMTLFGAGCC